MIAGGLGMLDALVRISDNDLQSSRDLAVLAGEVLLNPLIWAGIVGVILWISSARQESPARISTTTAMPTTTPQSLPKTPPVVVATPSYIVFYERVKEKIRQGYEVELLATSASSNDPVVRRNAAENPHTPVDVINSLARDSKWKVRAGVTYNPSAPTETLAMLTGDSWDAVRRKARKALDKRASATDTAPVEKETAEVPNSTEAVPGPGAPSVGPSELVIDQLERLANLYRDGLLTDDEYTAMKAKLIDGGAAEAGKATRTAVEQVATTETAPTDQPSADSEEGQIRPSTLARLKAARDHYGDSQLQSTLEEAQELLRSGDLDRATQAAIRIVVERITVGLPDEVERYCGSTAMTAYIVGRAMLGSEHSALHFSNPLTEADNVETLVRLATPPDALEFVNEFGPTGHLFCRYQVEMAGRAGPLSAMAQKDSETLAGGSAVTGLVLAFAEHDQFVSIYEDLKAEILVSSTTRETNTTAATFDTDSENEATQMEPKWDPEPVAVSWSRRAGRWVGQPKGPTLYWVSLGAGVVSVFLGGTFGLIAWATVVLAVVALSTMKIPVGRWMAWTGLALGIVFSFMNLYLNGQLDGL